MSFELEGHTAVVTGAARGIGLAIARRLHALGARVAGWDIEEGGGEPALECAFVVDVTGEASVARAAGASIEALGHVDILVNNAGVNGRTKPSWEYSLAEWQHVLAVDLTGVFLCCRALTPHMRGRGYGRMVTVASIAGKEGNPNACAYAAAKAGAIGFSKTLALELVDSGVTVNCVAPVITQTELFAEMTEDYIENRKAKIPMGRFCTVEEIANTVAFAASPLASFTTGFTYDVSGGRATY